MSLSSIKIKDFRNIHEIDLSFSNRLNQIIGPNGAGKTSILEAIYLLSRGRSFRSSDIRHQIRRDQPFMEITAYTSRDIHIGMRKSSRQVIVRVNQQNISKQSFLSQLIPTFAITPSSHQLIEGVPDFRRRFLDWGVFHVEHNYWKETQLYNRALRQRNNALRTDKWSAHLWDSQLIQHGNLLSIRRDDFINNLDSIFQHVIIDLTGVGDIKLKHYCGFDSEYSHLDVALREKLKIDQKRGFTSVGPHRGDIKIIYQSKNIKDTLSRGQQKMVAIALIISQVILISRSSQTKPVLLVDDVNSELDSKHSLKLMLQLLTLDVQVLTTSINVMSNLADESSRVFHVEHGSLIAVE